MSAVRVKLGRSGRSWRGTPPSPTPRPPRRFSHRSVETQEVSNVNQVRRPLGAPVPGGAPPGGSGVRPSPAVRPAATPAFPSAEGTAILNLTGEQLSNIRRLLIGLRSGKTRVEEVRSRIFGLLSGGQRRVLGQAWFIISVRV